VIQKLLDKLNKRKEEGTFRSLSLFTGIDFWSNDYLGLSDVPMNLSKITQYGSTGSRLISGNSSIAEKCEEQIAVHFNAEAALVYNSGYDANLGFFSSVPQKGDLVIYDVDIHASVRDGVRLSFAKTVSFAHNSLEDLEKKLQLAAETKYVAIESLYSMRGDFAPILAIVHLCEKYGAYLIVDEAHSGGIFGENGKGLIHGLGLENRVFARLITFGKAYGCHGAAVVTSQFMKDYLVNFSRSFIYSTALPGESYERISKVISCHELEIERTKLIDNCIHFRSLINDCSFEIESEPNSPIQFIVLGSVEKTIQIAQKLRSNNFLTKEIVSPTVAKGREGIRICIHSNNTFEEINELVQLLVH